MVPAVAVAVTEYFQFEQVELELQTKVMPEVRVDFPQLARSHLPAVVAAALAQLVKMDKPLKVAMVALVYLQTSLVPLQPMLVEVEAVEAIAQPEVQEVVAQEAVALEHQQAETVRLELQTLAVVAVEDGGRLPVVAALADQELSSFGTWWLRRYI